MRDDKLQRAVPVLSALGKSVCYLALFLGMQVAVLLPFSLVAGVQADSVYRRLTGLEQAALGGDADALYAELNANLMTYTMISGLLTLIIILAVYRLRRRPMAEALWLRGVDGPTLLTGAALAPGLYLIIGTLLMLLPKAWTESYNEASAGIDSGTLTGVLAVAVVAPVVEELIFRGLMLDRLRMVMPGWVAVLLSSAVFGACHGNPVWFGYAFALGAFFGFLDLRANSVLPSILGHLAFNAISQILSFVPETEDGSEAGLAVKILLLAAVAAPALNWRAITALFRRRPRRAALPAPRVLPTQPGTYDYDPWDE